MSLTYSVMFVILFNDSMASS